MPFASRLLAMLLLLLAGACTMRSAMEAMTSPEDRAFAHEFVEHLRSGDSEWLRRHFDDRLWADSAKEVAAAPALFPEQGGRTEIVSVNVSSTRRGGVTERTRSFTLVTEGGGRWTLTSFTLHSSGGPDRVVQWRVTPRDSPPPELEMMRSFDAAVPWMWAVGILVLLAAAALIIWLVRRSRRRRLR